jgi:hypothetical protein
MLGGRSTRRWHDGVIRDHADDIVMFDVPPYEFAASTPTATPGRGSSSGRHKAPCSTSSRLKSPLATTWPTPSRCCVAALLRCCVAALRHATGDRRETREPATTHSRAPEGGRSMDGGTRAPLVPRRQWSRHDSHSTEGLAVLRQSDLLDSALTHGHGAFPERTACARLADRNAQIRRNRTAHPRSHRAPSPAR